MDCCEKKDAAGAMGCCNGAPMMMMMRMQCGEKDGAARRSCCESGQAARPGCCGDAGEAKPGEESAPA